MFKVTDEDIENLVNKEYEVATQYGNTYNSDHEFYAVLKEEIEEAKTNIAFAEEELSFIWIDIKRNCEFEDNLKYIENHLKEAIKESLQCLAVIRKYKNKQL